MNQNAAGRTIYLAPAHELMALLPVTGSSVKGRRSGTVYCRAMATFSRSSGVMKWS